MKSSGAGSAAGLPCETAQQSCDGGTPSLARPLADSGPERQSQPDFLIGTSDLPHNESPEALALPSSGAQVLQGDCLALLPRLPSDSIDLILSDPPYGIRYLSDRGTPFGEIQGDRRFPTEWLAQAFRILKPGRALYCFCHWRTWPVLYAAASAAGFIPKNLLVFHKSNHGAGDLKGSYAPKHELCLFATKGRHLLTFPNGRDKDVIAAPIKFTRAHRWHPNEKPISWLEPLIQNSSAPGGLILDPFCGSGSTLAAATKLGRRGLGFEIDLQFAQIAQERLAL